MRSHITNQSSNIQRQSSIIRNQSRMTQAHCTTSTMINQEYGDGQESTEHVEMEEARTESEDDYHDE